MDPALTGAGGSMVQDIDLAGRLRLRVAGAPDRALNRIARQFGAAPEPPRGAPDLVLRFVERVGGREVRLIGLADAGWDDDGFYLLGGRGKEAPRARIPFEALGLGCEVVVDRHFQGVPLLVHLVNALLLAKGTLVLHASAVELAGRGVAAAGWSKGGKTEALLALLHHGGRPIADEWTYVDHDRRLLGSPGPVRLEDWHLDQLDGVRGRVPSSARRRMQLARGVQRIHRRVRGPIGMVPGSRYVERAVRLLDQERHVDVPATMLRDAGPSDRAPQLDRLLWVVASTADEIAVRPVDADDVARRMVFSHQHHRLSLLAAYYQYRFAFPKSPSELMETLEERERAALATTLDGTAAFEVRHPPRLRIDALARGIGDAIGATHAGR